MIEPYILDYIMTGVFVIFIFTFYPQIKDCYDRKCKMNRTSAGITIIGLSIVSVCLFLLNAPFSAVLEGVVSFEWLLCYIWSGDNSWLR